MNDCLYYSRYIVRDGEALDLENGESVVSRHLHPERVDTLIVWTEKKALKDVPLELLEGVEGGEGDE